MREKGDCRRGKRGSPPGLRLHVMKKNRECSSTRLNLDIGDFLLRSCRAGSVADGHGQIQSDRYDPYKPSYNRLIRGPRSLSVFPKLLGARTITGSRADAILLSDVGQDLDTDFAEALIRIGRRIVSDRVTVAQVLTNGFESLHLLLPGLCPISLATCTRRDAAKN